MHHDRPADRRTACIRRCLPVWVLCLLVGNVDAGIAAAPTQDLKEQTALAEAQVAIKKAAVKMAEVSKDIAETRIAALKAQVAAAKAREEYTKKKWLRFKALLKEMAVTPEIVDEAEAEFQSAQAARQESEVKLLIAEKEVALEAARVELAKAELAEAELRLKLLRERLKADR